jgi:hypothetical protein
MYAQIMIDCQSQTEQAGCEYCIGKRKCQLCQDIKENTENENLRVNVPILLTKKVRA